jgi:hypothetical protein
VPSRGAFENGSEPPAKENSASNSALLDKAYLPGVKPAHSVKMGRKERVIFHKNCSSLSIDLLSKLES